jgi:hypothetical protein
MLSNRLAKRRQQSGSDVSALTTKKNSTTRFWAKAYNALSTA